MVISGYQWLYMVINGYRWLSMVMDGYQWLCVVINGYTWLCSPILGQVSDKVDIASITSMHASFTSSHVLGM